MNVVIVVAVVAVGIRVQGVVRVNNRPLRTRFEDVLQSFVDEDDDGYLPNPKYGQRFFCYGAVSN